MNIQQKQLLLMLKEIHALCEKHGITYFISSGTLIGAVRHGGFLPWDDDADILMPYADWQRFKEVCRTELPLNRHLGCAEESETYGHLVPRYVAADTTAIHTCQSLHDDVAGEIVDIFVLDPVADGEEEYRSYLQDMYLYSAVASYSNAAGYRVALDPERFKHAMELQREHGKRWVIREIEKMMASHFDDAGDSYVLRWQSVPVRYRRSWFHHAVPVEFEGTTLMAPNGINDYLTLYYGEDWAEIPASINPSKHNTASSLRFPYTEALDFYEPTYDRAEIMKEMEERRYLIFKNAPANLRLRDDRIAAKIRLCERQTARHIEENRATFDRALADRDGVALAFILADYLNVQTSKEVIGRNFNANAYRLLNPLVLDVADEVFEAALLALIATDRVKFVVRLFELWGNAGHAVTPLMRESLDAVLSFRASVNDYQDGRYEEGLAIARELRKGHSESRMFLKLLTTQLGKLVELGREEYRPELEGALEEGRVSWPDDGYFLKQQADLVYAEGETDEARGMYLQAAESTRNGFALLDIYRKTGYHPAWMRSSKWGKAYGVEQWDGPDPSPLPASGHVAEPPAGCVADERQRYLFDLLAELAQRCDDAGVPYALGPVAAQAFFRSGWYPGKPVEYQLICTHAALEKLAELPAPADRKIEFAKDDATGAACLRYYGTDSLLLSWAGGAPGSSPHLAVIACTPEVADFSRTLERMKGAMRRLGRRNERRPFVAANILMKLGNRLVASRTKRESASASGLACVYGKRRVPFDAALLSNTQLMQFRDRCFRVPEDLDSYLASLGYADAAACLTVSPSYWCSSALTYNDLLDQGYLDATYFERKRQAELDARRGYEIADRFKANFDQIKLAVRLKELSLDLLPRKQEIVGLHKARDYRALTKILSGYLACVDKFEGRGEISFDDDIYRAMQATRMWGLYKR